MAKNHNSCTEQYMYGIELLQATGKKHVWDRAIASYWKKTAKNCYAEKLMTIGLFIEDDPFLPKTATDMLIT